MIGVKKVAVRRLRVVCGDRHECARNGGTDQDPAYVITHIKGKHSMERNLRGRGKTAKAPNTETISERLKTFRNSCAGLQTQQAFAEALGIDQQRLSGYEHGTRIPSHVICALVTLGANPYWLLFGEGPMRQGSASESVRGSEIRAINPSEQEFSADAMAEFYVLPLYADEVAAGSPRDVRDTEIEGPAVIHRSWCPHPENTDYVRVSSTGTSMEPTIPAGAMVTIDRSQTAAELLQGKIVAIAKREGGVTLKRLQKTERGGYVGMPDNLTPENLPIPLEEGDRIVGLVQTVHSRLY